MSALLKYSLIYVTGVLISAFSQIMLKKAAGRQYSSKIKEYLKPLVIIAYMLFFGCTLISMFALKVVPLSMSPMLEATGYIFVAVLSFIFFKERLNKRQLLGMALVFAGIVIFSLG